jgi:hypothetical protein
VFHTREAIPTPLEHALLATRVLAILHAVDKPQASTILAPVLDDAIRFLDSIMKGREYTKERRVSNVTFEYAFAYGEAIRAIETLPNRGRLSGEVNEMLADLIHTAKSLRTRQPVPSDSTERLISFFALLREVAVSNNTRPVETMSVSK